MRRKKLQPISVRLEEDVREGIKALADADERSLGSYINRALREHINAKKAAEKATKTKRS